MDAPKEKTIRQAYPVNVMGSDRKPVLAGTAVTLPEAKAKEFAARFGTVTPDEAGKAASPK